MLDLAWEKSLWRQGARLVAGADEAGRGPLAGPVVAACVVLGPDFKISAALKKVRDSKLIGPVERAELFQLLQEKISHFGVAIIDHLTIDRINILAASLLAMRQAAENTGQNIDHLLIDGNKEIPDCKFKQTAIIDGDHQVFAIAAASILAKVTRDRIMQEMHDKWPEYKFNEHKGYATQEHLRLIKQYGPCPIHRLSFSPFRQPKTTKMF
ncbi:MAG: ribonuclease HII [Candidatus Falkowbacteria bacterium]